MMEIKNTYCFYQVEPGGRCSGGMRDAESGRDLPGVWAYPASVLRSDLSASPQEALSASLFLIAKWGGGSAPAILTRWPNQTVLRNVWEIKTGEQGRLRCAVVTANYPCGFRWMTFHLLLAVAQPGRLPGRSGEGSA